MSPRAEAKAGPAPHGLLSALDHRPDLRTVRHLRERIEGRPYALKRISHALPDSPADLGQGVGELGVPVIAHGSILPLARAQGQGTFTQLRHVSDTLYSLSAALALGVRRTRCQQRWPWVCRRGQASVDPFGDYGSDVQRVVIVGPGAAGKSTLAAHLGSITGLPVIELDKLFWRPGLIATPHDQWAAIQRELVTHDSWIMDGDLGPHDVIDIRLQAADTIVFLDFSPARCAWRAIRRSRERADFWRWLFTYRRRSRPLIRQAIAAQAGRADLHVLPTPRMVRRFVAQIPRVLVNRAGAASVLAQEGPAQ